MRRIQTIDERLGEEKRDDETRRRRERRCEIMRRGETMRGWIWREDTR